MRTGLLGTAMPPRRGRGTVTAATVLLCVLACSLLLPLVSAQRLFFSLYVHSSSNSLVEVFNPSCFSVDLSAYDVRIAYYSTSAAGATWGTAIPLTGTLGSKGTYAMCRTAVGGCASTQSTLDFRGYDAVGLFHNGLLIDVIGSLTGMYGGSCQSGVATVCPAGASAYGAPWLVAGVVNATQLHAMKRKPTVTEGVTDFYHPNGKAQSSVDKSEWIVSGPTSYTLGSTSTYCTTGCACPSPTPANAVHKVTCGTYGSAVNSIAGVGGTVQIQCPESCLEQVLRLHVTPATFLARVTGSNPYSPGTPVCLAAIHSGVLKVNNAAFPSSSFSPQPAASIITELCTYGGASVLPAYTDSALFPASHRPRGRPVLKFTSLSAAQVLTSSAMVQPNCFTSGNSGGAGVASSWTVQIQNTTACQTGSNECGVNGGQGYCDQNTGRCVCNTGYSGSYCTVLACSTNCNSVAGGGTCNTATGTCGCNSGWSGSDCTIKACPGTPACSDHGDCDTSNGVGTCHCYGPYFGTDCSLKLCLNNCTSNGVQHGTCDYTTGTCLCQPGYLGEDCSLKLCGDYCKGFGSCDYTTGQCRCINTTPAGSTQPAQCDYGVCPTATDGLVCSGQGYCDYATRLCQCNSGYVGVDCATQV